MENNLDQETLDKLVAVLSTEQGNHSLDMVRVALHNKIAEQLQVIEGARGIAARTYRAYQALGGTRLTEIEPLFLPPAPEPEPVEAQVIRPIGTPTKSTFVRRWRRIDLDPADLAAFCNLVLEEFGRPPSQAAIGHYFGMAKGSVSKQVMKAREAGYNFRTPTGGHTPAGFDHKVARRFGTYQQRKKE